MQNNDMAIMPNAY